MMRAMRDFRSISGLYLWTDHKVRYAPAASLGNVSGTTIVRGFAFIPDDENSSIASGAEFGPSENIGKVVLEPTVGRLKGSVMGIFVNIGRDEGKVHRLTAAEVGFNVVVGHALDILPGPRADVGKVGERIVVAVVGVVWASIEPLEAFGGQVLLV